MSNRNLYLVGSVPGKDESEVFSTLSKAFGQRLRYVPDGETGERLNWVAWLEPIFANSPALTQSEELFKLHDSATGFRRYKLKPGKTVNDVVFDNLFYADVAKKSYATFVKLKAEGKIHPTTKFQIDLVPAQSVLWLFLVDELQMPLDPVFNEALKLEVDKITATLPHDDIAIQFDVASAVFARLHRGVANGYGATKAEMLERFSQILADLSNRVPASIDLLIHLCYGDNNHKHSVEPIDMGDMVQFTHHYVAKLKRPLQLIHMPVPRDRSDEAYFAPLKNLKLPKGCELCLGLVHYTDGVEGTLARMKTARKFVEDFSIGTECGFGRRDPATIPELLRIHDTASRAS